MKRNSAAVAFHNSVNNIAILSPCKSRRSLEVNLLARAYVKEVHAVTADENFFGETLSLSVLSK